MRNNRNNFNELKTQHSTTVHESSKEKEKIIFNFFENFSQFQTDTCGSVRPQT